MIANPQGTAHQDGGAAASSSQPVLELRVGSRLDPGLKRKDRPNEDSLFIAQDLPDPASVLAKPFALFVVADGMGGQDNGREASQLAITSLVDFIFTSLRSKPMTSDTFLPLLLAGVRQANAVVYQRNQERRMMMGTTMTAALVSGATAYLANVGDSRIYRYHPSIGLCQITRDHSVVARLVDVGMIKHDDIYTHPMRNQIYRCLGAKPVETVDGFVVPLIAGDMLLLCSDGLWEMVRDPHIAAILATTTTDPSLAVHRLVEVAKAGGGLDNIAVIVVHEREMSYGLP